jgi:hypothetical protein
VPLGFNSDLKLGDLVFHVQTEDRRPRSTAVDTTVYSAGRVVYRRKTTYGDRLGEPGFDESSVRQLLEEQHRAVLEGLRSGEIAIESFPPPPPRAAAGARAEGGDAGRAASATAVAEPPANAPPIKVLLTNPASWLSAGSARLLVEVRSREPEGPVPNAVVEVSFEGVQRPFVFKTATDAWGRAEVGFPLPKFGPAGASLVIKASTASGADEIRYSLRPKSSSGGD